MQAEQSLTAIEETLAALGDSPRDSGTVELIVCRPQNGERQVLDEAELDTAQGLIGDNWIVRGSRHTPDGNAHPELQIAIMNSRVIQAIAQDKDRWALAGDQLFLDFDLSTDNLAIGERLRIGTVLLEITPYPHTGCGKFTERFGSGATHFVNSKEGRAARRRGINARVIQGGTIRKGDVVQKDS